MSTDNDVARSLRSWLRENRHEDADRVLDAVFDQVPATPQRRARWLARRLPPMNSTSRIGIAAAVVVIAAILGFTYLNNQVGSDATPTPIPSAAAGAIPAELQYSFIGEVRAATLDFGGDRSIFTLTDSTFEFQTGNGVTFPSDASIASSGELLLVSQSGSGGCVAGDEGRYPFALSPGGSILTILAGTDACAERAEALPGSWQRSACSDPDNACLGNIEAGTYLSQFIEPRPSGGWKARLGAIRYTVPEGWAATADWPEFYTLMTQADYATFDAEACSECADQINVYVNPMPAALDCSEAPAAGVGISVDEIVTWMTEHPGLVVTAPEPISIGGLDGTILDVEMASDWTGTCPGASGPIVMAPTFFNGYQVAVKGDDRQRFILLDLGGGDTVVIVIDSNATADFDSVVGEAMPIVQTFEFPAR